MLFHMLVLLPNNNKVSQFDLKFKTLTLKKDIHTFLQMNHAFDTFNDGLLNINNNHYFQIVCDPNCHKSDIVNRYH